MLMSLTIRFCPVPSADSRGTTSVVAIPIPSFSWRVERIARDLWIAQEETFHYTGIARCAPQIEHLKPGGTRFGNAELVRGLKILFCRTGRCYETYYIVTRAIQQGGSSSVPCSVFAGSRPAGWQPLRGCGGPRPRAPE